jgi:hypothetical protein
MMTYGDCGAGDRARNTMTDSQILKPHSQMTPTCFMPVYVRRQSFPLVENRINAEEIRSYHEDVRRYHKHSTLPDGQECFPIRLAMLSFIIFYQKSSSSYAD